MHIQNQQEMREKVEEKQQISEGNFEKEAQLIASKQQPPPATASPPSPSSSPSHEFSFTISLDPKPPKINHDNNKATKLPTPPPPFAIDLSPADDIFFHGHLLPLHLLSHLPVSPRSSTNSLDSFTLPIKELLEDQNTPVTTTTTSNTNSEMNGSRRSNKSKSFSLFGLPKWRKGCEEREKEENYKKKLRFEVSQVLKKYMRMVRPLWSFRGIRRSNTEIHRQPYSFSGSLGSRNQPEQLRGRRRELFSAPASMRTSPTNSGLLLATSGTGSPTTKNDSTMEELQAAIQAAIAHCKNSISMGEKFQCQEIK